MGCTNSNIGKVTHNDVQPEERNIRAAESLLVFSRKNIEENLNALNSVCFELDNEHVQLLCDTFKISEKSSTGLFLVSLLSGKRTSVELLRLIMVLVSEMEDKDKLKIIDSDDREKFLDTVRQLVYLSFEIIPQNLNNVDTSSLLYADSLKLSAREFISTLSHLSLPELKKVLSEIGISSKEIRYKLLSESKKMLISQKLDLNNQNFFIPSPENPDLIPDLQAEKAIYEEINSNTLNEKASSNSINLHKTEDIQDPLTEENLKSHKDPAEFKESHPGTNLEPINDSDLLKNGITDETGQDLKSFLEKIPGDTPDDFTLTEESQLIPSNPVQDHNRSNSTNKDESLSKPETSEQAEDSKVQKQSTDDLAPRRMSAVDLYIQKCKEKKSPEPADKPVESKIPSKSKILTKIKSLNSLTKLDQARPTRDAEDSRPKTLKSPKLYMQHQSKLVSPKDHESIAKLDSNINLSESELLRSKISKPSDHKHLDKQEVHKSLNHKEEAKKESKIGSIKEKSVSEEHEAKPGLSRRDSKIGSIKSKK